MIIYADDKLKPKVMRMWQICFGDADDFTEMYFRTKYRNENTLIKIVDGKAVASLQMLPYEMTFGNGLINTAYISGACTLPEERKKGYMDELLIRSFYEMRKRRIPVSTLIPQESWLFGFYEKFGYSSVFDVGKTRVKLPGNFDDSVYTVRLADLNDVDLVASFYAGISGKTDLMIQKTPDDWCAVFEDYFLAGGDVLLAFDRQKIAGICFVVEDKDDVIVKGLLTETEDAKKALLASVAGRCNVRDAILVTSGIDNNSIPLGMARITDVNCMLALFARKYPFLDFSVKVTDDRLFENNATFKIGSGNCVAIDSRNPDFEVPVSLLTRLLFGYKIMELPEKYRIFPSGNPIMNLMME